MDDKMRRINPSIDLPRALRGAAPHEEAAGPMPRPPASPSTSAFPIISSTMTGEGWAPSATEVCAHCDGAGYYKEAVPFGHPHFGVLFPCQCKLTEQAGRRQEQQARRLAQLTGLAGRFADATLDSFDLTPPPAPVEWYDLNPIAPRNKQRRYSPQLQERTMRDALATVRAWADEPRGSLLLQGPYGSGKTHLAYAAAREIVLRNHSLACDTLPDLLQFIRDGFEDNSAGQRIQDLKTVDVLILDDAGAEYETDWTVEKVYSIVNHRYVFQLWTIFTSNVPVAYLHGRIGSRIAEMATVVSVIAYDHRLLGRKTA